MPDSASKLLDTLGVDSAARDFAHLGANGRLGTLTIDKPEPVFPRYVEPESDNA